MAGWDSVWATEELTGTKSRCLPLFHQWTEGQVQGQFRMHFTIHKDSDACVKLLASPHQPSGFWQWKGPYQHYRFENAEAPIPSNTQINTKIHFLSVVLATLFSVFSLHPCSFGWLISLYNQSFQITATLLLSEEIHSTARVYLLGIQQQAYFSPDT